MAVNLYIPRLEWNDITGLTGDTTNNDPNVTGISSTERIREGMIVTGVGIPAETRIVSKTLTSVVLSQNATASGSAVALTFFERLDFVYPPKFDSEEKLKPQQKITTALSGVQQIQTDHLKAERELEFWFLTQEDADLLKQWFYIGWAVYGRSFRYYPDQDDSVVFEYTLNKFDFQRDRQVKKHPEFLYKLKFSFRRVVV